MVGNKEELNAESWPMGPSIDIEIPEWKQMPNRTNAFEKMAAQFVEQNDMDDPQAQFDVVEEEVEELEDALDGNGSVQEEMADVVVTMHIMADMLGIDLKAAYEKKMEYNLSKSATKDENNKVTDDADIDKPQFHDTVGGVQ